MHTLSRQWWQEKCEYDEQPRLLIQGELKNLRLVQAAGPFSFYYINTFFHNHLGTPLHHYCYYCHLLWPIISLKWRAVNTGVCSLSPLFQNKTNRLSGCSSNGLMTAEPYQLCLLKAGKSDSGVCKMIASLTESRPKEISDYRTIFKAHVKFM